MMKLLLQIRLYKKQLADNFEQKPQWKNIEGFLRMVPVETGVVWAFLESLTVGIWWSCKQKKWDKDLFKWVFLLFGDNSNEAFHMIAGLCVIGCCVWPAESWCVLGLSHDCGPVCDWLLCWPAGSWYVLGLSHDFGPVCDWLLCLTCRIMMCIGLSHGCRPVCDW